MKHIVSTLLLSALLLPSAVLADEAVQEEEAAESTLSQLDIWEEECRDELEYGDRELRGTLVFMLRRCINTKRNNLTTLAEFQGRLDRLQQRRIPYRFTRGSTSDISIHQRVQMRVGASLKATTSNADMYRRLTRQGMRQNERSASQKNVSESTQNPAVLDCLEKPYLLRWMCLQSKGLNPAIIREIEEAGNDQ